MFYLIAKAAGDVANSVSGTGGVAEESAIVTCSGMDCTVCSFMQMIVNLFSYLTWYIAFPLAILFLVIGGFIYIGSRGNDTWMSFAKRGIMYTVGGFCVSILAWLAINTLIQVVGGGGGAPWEQFECGGSSSASLNKMPQISTSQLINSEKNGGQLSGLLSAGTTPNDIMQMMDQLSPSDMLVFQSELGGARKSLMAVGKKNGQTQLLYVDRATINSVLQERVSSRFFNEANAEETSVDMKLQELLDEISQLTARIIASNHNLFVIITGKPETESVSAILGAISKVEQCVSTTGMWYAFPDICTAQQQACGSAKCIPAGGSLVASCKCPASKCLSGGQCINKQP